MIKKFTIDFFLFSTPFLLLLFTVSRIVDKGLRKNHNDWYATWNNIYSSNIESDVLIMGSSRAVVHVSPPILDSILHRQSYNFGQFGWLFLLQNCRFKVFLEHNPKPKIIIQTLDISTLDKHPTLPTPKEFAPYFNDSIIRRYTSSYDYEGGFSFIDVYFPLYKYNNNLSLIVEGCLNLFNLKPSFSSKYKGYIGVERAFSPHQDTSTVVQKVNAETAKEFEDYLQYCQKNDIKVILVYTPEHRDYQKRYLNRQDIIDLYKKYAHDYNALFLDYSQSSLTKDTQYFYNPNHLNKKGSEIFSTQLALDIDPRIHEFH